MIKELNIYRYIDVDTKHIPLQRIYSIIKIDTRNSISIGRCLQSLLYTHTYIDLLKHLIIKLSVA